MNHLPKDPNGCPYLILAPMEGVGDRCFRKAIASVGGFDAAIRDFLRVPKNAHIKSLAVDYNHDELDPFPLAAQIMGGDPILMGEMAYELQQRGARHIDVNCGCPSNTVTGRGAGSSLLKNPDFVFQVAKEVVKSVSVPVSVKMRIGYEDTSLFRENLLAAQESGVTYITVHARTKVDGYGPPARWEFIAEAKSLLKIPVVGNGDIINVKAALDMLKQTNCDALMIGRGCVINPFLFHQIKAHFAQKPYNPEWIDLVKFFEVYLSEMRASTPARTKINKLKQLFSFVFRASEELLQKRNDILTAPYTEPAEFMHFGLQTLRDKVRN